MSVKDFLEENFAVQIHDISHSKILTFQSNVAHAVSSIKAFSSQFGSFMKEY